LIKENTFINNDKLKKKPKTFIERYVSKNIDAQQLLNFFKTHIQCYMCKVHFTEKNKPTLDRIDNKKGHSLDNVEACCLYCNRVKSDKDKGIVQFKIQLRKYCVKNNLPMTLSDEVTYHILRDGITGGLSNVGHRFNVTGETKINKFEIVKYDDGSYHAFSVDTKNIMTHICGCDFSSLYPSVYSSNTHPFIQYTGHNMYMPGYQLDRLNKENSDEKTMGDIIFNPNRFECEDQMIIDSLPYTVAVVKGHIVEKYLQDYIDFAPIIKKLHIITNKHTLSEYMYYHMISNKLSYDKQEYKLTQLLSTHDQFMSFGM
jgi:hypothetical protein